MSYNKLLLAFAPFLLTSIQSAYANTVDSTGAVGSVCYFDAGSEINGVLTVASDLTELSSFPVSEGGFSGASAASINVRNNNPAGFSITVSTPSAFLVKPAGYDATPSFSMSYILDSAGANPEVAGQTGSLSLSSAGADTIQIRNAIDNGSDLYIAGSYTVQNTITCAAN